MYYGDNSSSVIHPLISYLAVTLGAISKLLGGNWFSDFAVSSECGLRCSGFIFLSQNEKKSTPTPLLFALLFGFSSYLMFTAFIPDSYPYVQFVILLSVLYLQYSRVQQEVHYVPNALLATINFGLTSTNIVPFAGAVFVNMQAWRSKAGWKNISASCHSPC